MLGNAIAHFRRAAELAPDSAPVRSDLGGALAAAGLTDEALIHIRRALDLDPDYAPAYANLGSVYLALGRRAEARRALEHAFALDRSPWVEEQLRQLR